MKWFSAIHFVPCAKNRRSAPNLPKISAFPGIRLIQCYVKFDRSRKHKIGPATWMTMSSRMELLSAGKGRANRGSRTKEKCETSSVSIDGLLFRIRLWKSIHWTNSCAPHRGLRHRCMKAFTEQNTPSLSTTGRTVSTDDFPKVPCAPGARIQPSRCHAHQPKDLLLFCKHKTPSNNVFPLCAAVQIGHGPWP